MIVEAKVLKDSNTNTDSDRVLVVKRGIFRALSELMDEKDFGNISVGDILERSGVSRTTFYRHFADKYDVINWSYKRFKNIRIQDRDLYYSFETSLRVQLQYLADHQHYFALALRYTGQNSLRDFMFEANEEYMIQCWHEAHGTDRPDYAIYSMMQFAAAGMSKIIEQWIVAGCQQEPEEVVKVMVSLMPEPLAGVLY